MTASWPRLLFLLAAAASAAGAPLDIGSRLELFVDRVMADRLEGGAELRLHAPQPREVVFVFDRPWEGNTSGYPSVFRDGDRFRLYYKGWHRVFGPGGVNLTPHELVCCYAESDDGIRWRRPELGLVDFQSSRANNILLTTGQYPQVDAGHTAVFRDDNPAAAPEARYKAFLRYGRERKEPPAAGRPARGLVPFQSPDGIHWTPLTLEPVITDGWFDSQNLAFWDPVRREYRAYWRYFASGRAEAPTEGIRSVRTATSLDFRHWSAPQDLAYFESPPEELYLNQILPYARAPHLFIGLPTRYLDRGWSDSLRALPEAEHRQWRANANRRLGTALTEGLLMASRDGVNFRRWPEAFLRPGPERPGTWNYGQHEVAWQVVQTKSELAGAPDELSLYSLEGVWTGDDCVLRRYTLRLDGFVSVAAPMSGGEVTTPLLRFTGDRLQLNFSTSAAGDIRVEIQDEEGRALPGFGLADCPPVFGDAIDRVVTWTSGIDVSAVSGRPVRLRFVLRDADLYAFQFQPRAGGDRAP
ncbi:MAG: hypothetical protein JNG83_03880 [Opitutaceae bacterium]|nr:hypothetical protein [Opitutaceae bacterium]